MENVMTDTKNTQNFAAAQKTDNADLVFFLGGADTEMVRIAEVASAAGCEIRDAGLSWGAKASAYGDQFADVVAEGKIPVLVELEVDCELPETAVDINHHNNRADEAPAILQALDLLEVKPIRWDLIVGVNDAGWFPGLAGTAEVPGVGILNPPATEEEMKKVRSGDYGLQGITDEMLSEIDRALTAPVEMIGPVRVVRMSHSKCGPVGDYFAIPAFANGEDIPQYIVFSEDGETNFSGDGAICAEFIEKFPEAPAPWNPDEMIKAFSGGAGFGKAGQTGFCGGYSDQAEIEAWLILIF